MFLTQSSQFLMEDIVFVQHFVATVTLSLMAANALMLSCVSSKLGEVFQK